MFNNLTPAQELALGRQRLRDQPNLYITTTSAGVASTLIADGYSVLQVFNLKDMQPRYLVFADLPSFAAEIKMLDKFGNLIPQMGYAYAASNVAAVDAETNQMFWRPQNYNSMPDLAQLRPN